MNYNTLTTQIINYANRSDAFFLTQVPDFINQGINRIYSEAKSIGFEITVAGLFLVGTNQYQKPADWKQTISITVNQNGITKLLLPRSLEFCQTYWSNPALTDVPQFYADILAYDSFYYAPTQNAAVGYRITYLGLPLFNAQNPVNFLTERYPRLLLYACLTEAMIFLKNDERLPVVESLYKSALQGINTDASNRYNDRTSKRDKD